MKGQENHVVILLIRGVYFYINYKLERAGRKIGVMYEYLPI